MIPDYPERLLPKPSYQKIDDFKSLGTWYLQRAMPNSDFLLKSGAIDAAKVKAEIPSSNVADLSTNLIGIFLPEDRQFEWTTEGKSTFTEDWNPSAKIKSPVSVKDYLINSAKGQIFLSIKSCLNFKITYNIGEIDGLIASCRVLHTPLKGNFWHVSLRWYNEEGDELSPKKGWRRRVLISARALISEHGITSLESVQEIPENLYILPGGCLSILSKE